jgi:ribosomal protein S18 acetylase RimI-like enzyme
MLALHEEFGRRRITVSVLEVNAEDRGARQFYEKLDYEYLEMLQGYYYGRLDAYRMVRFM